MANRVGEDRTPKALSPIAKGCPCERATLVLDADRPSYLEEVEYGLRLGIWEYVQMSPGLVVGVDLGSAFRPDITSIEVTGFAAFVPG